MKIMSFMNVSNPDNLGTDSGYKFYDILAGEFVAAGHEFVFVGPAPLRSAQAGFIPFDFGSNKYEFRFNFNVGAVSGIIAQACPDIVIVNQVELVPHFCVCLEVLGNTSTRVVAYAHYIPFFIDTEGDLYADSSLNARGLNRAITHAFFSGLEMADQVFLHSSYAQEYILAAGRRTGRRIDLRKFSVLPPPRDESLRVEQAVPASSKMILYNHRLYEHYGAQHLVQLAPRLGAIGADITILDILGSRTAKRRALDHSPDILRGRLSSQEHVFIIADGACGDEYRSIIGSSRFALAPMRPNCTWSMSCIDCMAMGKPVLAPDMAWFKEFIPEALRFSDDEEALEIAYRLLYDDTFYQEVSDACLAQTRSLSPATIAGRFIQAFLTLKEVVYADRFN